MSFTRREVLAGLGVASAQALLWACGGAPKPAKRPRSALVAAGEVRTWLHDAVAMLRGAGYEQAQALAVARRRTTAALDVIGAGVARGRWDGVVLSVRERDGTLREQVTCDLSAGGIVGAVRLILGGAKAKPASFDAGTPVHAAPLAGIDPDLLTDGQLLQRVYAINERDPVGSSRIVYAAALLDIDDATVWSVAPGRDLEQRLVRVRRTATRVAWNGTRPVVSEAQRAWRGGVDDQDLEVGELVAAREHALALMTPGAFDEGDHAIALEPTVVASLVDVAVGSLLTPTASRRPEVAKRLAVGAAVASPAITLVDDPTAAGAYGGFSFDDLGEPARAVPLVDKGHVVGRLERGLRPGHVGRLAAAPSHLRVSPGTLVDDALVVNGFALEGALGATVDPSSDRVVVRVARAREKRGGKLTGRVYADIELVGELGPLLASVTGASKTTIALGMRDEIDAHPRWRSIEAPWLAAKGTLRAVRRLS